MMETILIELLPMLAIVFIATLAVGVWALANILRLFRGKVLTVVLDGLEVIVRATPTKLDDNALAFLRALVEGTDSPDLVGLYEELSEKYRNPDNK